MKPGQSIFLIIVIAAVIVFAISFTKGCKPANNDEQELQLQMLRQRFDSLSLEIKGYKDSLKKYDDAIVDLKLRDSELTGKLEYNKQLQTKLKTEYGKTNRFTHANSSEITKYFSDSLN